MISYPDLLLIGGLEGEEAILRYYLYGTITTDEHGTQWYEITQPSESSIENLQKRLIDKYGVIDINDYKR